LETTFRTSPLDFEWTAAEKKLARQAFQKAYENEMASIRSEVLHRAKRLKEADDIWNMHGYLSQKKREINQKYDYRYSVLIYVLAVLLTQGLLSESDLVGLSRDKLAAIAETMGGLAQQC
jgi:hypothetical protein